MEVRKEIIRPGTYTYINPASGMPERMTVTPETIKHFHDQGSAMLADNISIPVPFEHQPDAKPQTESERAAKQLLNNAGFVKRYEVAKVENEDRLFGILDIPDVSVVKKLPTTIRSVSPWINSFTDGNGKRWEGVISHVALTTRPRISNQAPFETTGAAMSMIGGLSDKVFSSKAVDDRGFFLSRAGHLVKENGAFKPEFPIAFSLMAGIKLSEDEIEDIDDDEDTDDVDADDAIVDDPAVDQFSGDNTMAGLEQEAGDVSFEELIPHLLELHGITIPAGGKGKDFLKALVRGLLASAKSLAAADGGEDDSILGDDPAATPAAGPVTQESPPMYMSLTKAEVAKIVDPKERSMAEAFLSLRMENDKYKAKVDAVNKNILDDATKDRGCRIEKLCKKLPPAARDKVLQAAAMPSMQLSLGNDGAVKDPMATMLEVFEAGIPDIPSMLMKGIKLSEQPQPEDGVVTDERAQQLANQLLGRLAPVS